MIVPWQNLEASTLENIIESFIMREGTDYGEVEISLDKKKAQLLSQLKSGHVVLVYSELHETVNLMTADTFNRDANHAE